MTAFRNLTLGSLFDGIGGFPYAALFCGIRPLWASEILPACVSVTKRHLPEMAHVGDITRLTGGSLPPVDIITFGSPCQGLSISGRRLGLADERSGLFSEAIRIIREMQEVTNGRYPQIAVWENVPGCLSSNGGRDFKAVLQSLTAAQIPVPKSGQWANAGMVRGRGADLAWCVYNAQYFGTAQRRRRVFLVADFRGRRAGEILFVPKSLRWYFEAGGTPREGIAAFIENGPGTTGTEVEILNDQGGASMSVERDGVSPTLRSQTHGNLPIIALKTLCISSSQANAGIMENLSPTLTTAHYQQPILLHPLITGTLCASGAGLSRPGGMANELDFCVTSAGFRYKAGGAADGIGYQEETAPTLVAGQPSGTLIAQPDNALWSAIKYFVRRLTPTECERLQGFPDGWTKHGCDGKPISDTRRYEMLGNSVAVPCVAYILQGIKNVLNRR